MQLLLDVIGGALLIAGTAFSVLGVYGVTRLPDIYTRLQATGMVITGGAGCVLLSLLFLAESRAGFKALATAAFLLLTAPMVTHTLTRAAYRLRVPLVPDAARDDLADARRHDESG
jgi:multicomponent Na+:H+ antiporter subunit G